ncbi:MAG: hypothetical protein Tsb009_39530 [Planctomycetaceae bacterium]
MLRRIRITWTLVVALFLAGGVLASSASACPMCKQANETKDENRVPQAYMYSILFMLAMPATLLTGFGLTFYRMTKRSKDGLEKGASSPADHHLLPNSSADDPTAPNA